MNPWTKSQIPTIFRQVNDYFENSCALFFNNIIDHSYDQYLGFPIWDENK